MSDLVERLREDARGGLAYHELSDQAADRIEALERNLGMMVQAQHKLEGEKLRLEKALRCFLSFNEIMGDIPDDSDVAMAQAKYVEGIDLARAALKDAAP